MPDINNEYSNAHRALDKFKTWKDGYAGDAELAPDHAAIDVAHDLIRKIRRLAKRYRHGLEMIVPEVVPAPMGDILMYYRNDLVELELTIHEGGEQFSYWLDDRHQKEEHEENDLPIEQLIETWEAWAIRSVEAFRDQWQQLARDMHEMAEVTRKRRVEDEPVPEPVL